MAEGDFTAEAGGRLAWSGALDGTPWQDVA